MKYTIKNCRQNNNVVNFAILQMRSTQIGAGTPSPAILLFNRPIMAWLPKIGRKPINANKDDGYY